MSRLPLGRRGPVAAVATLAVTVASAAPALAQAGPPQPVIDSAPRQVRFTGAAVIRGHLENGTPADEVSLERAKPGRGFRTIATKRVDEESRVVFRVRELRRTADYRLAWRDEVAGAETTSGVRRVRVRPKLTLRVSPDHLMRGRNITMRGALRPAVGSRNVRIQRYRSGAWRTIDTVGAGDGDFRTTFRMRQVGRKSLRVRFGGDRFNVARFRSKRVKVFDPEPATWYGPGFYGNRTACGKRLGRGTPGVAHRSLPCGTRVSLLYRGRTVTVPVIDRGPYSSANWDLTRETADRLNFQGRDHVGVVRGG